MFEFFEFFSFEFFSSRTFQLTSTGFKRCIRTNHYLLVVSPLRLLRL